MESWDPRQVKSCLLTPHHHHLWPQEMPFKNLHRRRSGLTPKTKGILSHSNTNTTTYACTLTHSQPYMHAYTHKPAQLFKKLRTIFFFHKAPQNFQWTRNALTTETWSYQEQTSQANRPLWSGGRDCGVLEGGVKQHPKQIPFLLLLLFSPPDGLEVNVRCQTICHRYIHKIDI